MTAIRHPRHDRVAWRDGATHTRAIVAFHSDEGFDGIVNGEHPRIGRIMSVSMTKSFGGASGSFTITIKKPPRPQGVAGSVSRSSRSWLRLWPDPENTWVRISFIVDGEVIAGTWGLIDTISESTSRSGGGAQSETYTISGRDFGKVFEETRVFVNVFNTSSVRSTIATQRSIPVGTLVGTPEVFVRALIEMWLANNNMTEKVWEFPESLRHYGLSFYDVLNKSTIQCMNAGNGETHDNTLLQPDQQSGQPLWGSLQQYSNGLMNELWVDLAPPAGGHARHLAALEPAIYLRERMFRTHASSRRWESLRTRVLRPEDVLVRQVSKGGAANRFNYWKLDGGFLGSGFANQELVQDLGPEAYRPGSIPIINDESIRKHGLRPYQQTSNFLPMDDTENGQNFLTLASNWLQRLHDWYSVAPLELTGTLTTSRIFPEIRIGERVREDRAEGRIIYYVEGVEHSYRYPGNGSSKITVTHGEYEGEDLLERVYRQFERPRVTTQEDCMDIIQPASRITTGTLGGSTEAETDDFLAQLAAGCRLRAVPAGNPGHAGDDIESTAVAGTPAFEINGFDITADEGRQGQGQRGLIQEGAQSIECALGPAPDPEMIPSAADRDGGHANRIATGQTTNTVPASDDPADMTFTREEARVALSEERLEEDQPIEVPPESQLSRELAFTDSDSDDPLFGLPP